MILQIIESIDLVNDSLVIVEDYVENNKPGNDTMPDAGKLMQVTGMIEKENAKLIVTSG